MMVSKGLTKTQHHRLQKLRQHEIEENIREEERDRWFNKARPMVMIKRTWGGGGERLAKEEGEDTSSSEGDNNLDVSQEEVVTEEVIGLVVAMTMDVNMVFAILEEFRAPESEVVELTLGAERAVFEKPVEVGKHMKPLFIKGHMDGKPMGWMMVDGGASVKTMSLDVFRKLGHEEDLKKTNLSLSGFSRD
jgi:hypothetical protein